MTNFTFHKARNFPMNRDGETIEVQASEGDLVGLNRNTDDETEILEADADSGVQQPAMGVLLEDVRDPTDPTVSGYEDAYIEQQQLRREMREETSYTFVGEEGTYVFTGVYVRNNDEDTNFDAQEPVYLGVGGGFTQTKPTGSGEIVQRLGVAVDRYTVLVDVDFEYETLA